MSIAASPSAAKPTVRFSLDSYPGINPFAIDLVKESSSAARFCPRKALDTLQPPRSRRNQDELVEALIRQNASWGNDVALDLHRWNDGETIGVIAGQQVVFAGGPLLVLSKIASLIRLREKLTASRLPSTLFFWLATEDHDYDEVSTLTLSLPEGKRVLRARERPLPRHVVGTLPIPASLRDALLEHIRFDATPSWLRDGITFRDSFAELLSEVFRGQHVVFVDSLLPELRVRGRELFRRVIDLGDKIEDALRKRSAEMTEAGYVPQVAPLEDGHYTLLYRIDDQGTRQPIRRSDDGWVVGEDRIEASQLLRIVDSEPQTISTGVLTRPLLQDFVFGPDVFIGGPAEVTYYGQVSALHDLLGVRPPHVGLRGHLLAAAAKTLRAMERYGITPDELFENVEKVIAAHDPHSLRKVDQRTGQARESIAKELKAVHEAILRADPSLQRSLDRTIRRIAFHIDKLEQRGRAAAVRQDRERFRALSRLLETLAPDGVPQDRQTSWLPWWLQWREALPARLIEEVEPDSDVVKIIGL